MYHKIQFHYKRLKDYFFYFGIIKGLYYFIKLWFKKGIISIKIDNIKYPLFLRGRTTDINVFEEVIMNKAYNLTFINRTPNVIIDCGANIGLTSIFFSNLYPESKIICVEPETSNFNLLQKNIEQYPNIKAIKAGVWNKKTFLKIDNPEEGNWGFIVSETTNNEDGIRAVSIDEIMELENISQIDILKMDIEGSEYEVFDINYQKWIDKFDNLIIEYHERFKPGVIQKVEERIGQYKWQKKLIIDNVIYFDKSK
jgi:FkbM family methyltransferase